MLTWCTLASVVVFALLAGSVASAPLSAGQPIILVPGVGGSVMNQLSDQSNTVWVSIFDANSDVENSMLITYNASSGYAYPLTDTEGIIVPPDDAGLYAISNLDPNAIWPASKITAYFDDMISDLVDAGWVQGQTLFGFPYDWRQSNTLPDVLASLHELCKAIYKSTGKNPALVSHSMGGMISQSYFDVYGASVVTTWVAIAHPHLGGTGPILEAITQGYTFGDILLKSSLGQEMGLASPAFYELMPNPFHTWKYLPMYQVAWTNGSTIQYGPDDYIFLLQEALADYSFTYNGVKYERPFNDDIWKVASDAMYQWHLNSTQPEGLSYYHIYGTGLSTNNAITYTGISKPADLLTATQSFLTTEGDGTVALESATTIPAGWSPLKNIEITGVTHFGLVLDTTVIDYVIEWTGGSTNEEVLKSRLERAIENEEADRLLHGNKN